MATEERLLREQRDALRESVAALPLLENELRVTEAERDALQTLVKDLWASEWISEAIGDLRPDLWYRLRELQ